MSQASSQTPHDHLATLADLTAIPEDERWHEILDGELVEKASPSAEHAFDQAAITRTLAGFHGRSGGPGGLGGWWIATEPTVKLAPHQYVQPDLAAWRRDRWPERPTGYPILARPDWVCEIGTDGDARRRDGVKKRRIYADHGVGHYWLLDVEQGTLTVLRLVTEGYEEVLRANRGEVVRAEPFEGIPLSIGQLLGED